MSDMQFLMLASQLLTRAEEILVRAANTSEQEIQQMMCVTAASYENLARHAKQGFEHSHAHARHGRAPGTACLWDRPPVHLRWLRAVRGSPPDAVTHSDKRGRGRL